MSLPDADCPIRLAIIPPDHSWHWVLRTQILTEIRREDVLPLFQQHEITGLWFPLPKQTLRRLLGVPKDETEFFKLQQHLLCKDWSASPLPKHWHLAFEDVDDMMRSVKILGEGGFGLVDQVVIGTHPKPTICVRKRIGRPTALNGQKKLFEALRREIDVMRQVSHRHCVELVGSYTDLDSVAILSSPVADMDLAVFLDLNDVSPAQLKTLRQGIGCLCSALAYLHAKHIRHGDLKPQNVLLHGENILLTDFGFSLDFSDDCISTTTGRPSAWTARYAAPEVLNFEPRNRATDIYSLGCIIYEMISRLRGHRLSEVKSHWKQTGNQRLSFSLNAEARDSWVARLFSEINDHIKDQVLLLFTGHMLNANRYLRPTAKQIVNKLEDLDRLLPSDSQLLSPCCTEDYYLDEQNLPDLVRQQLYQRRRITAGYALPAFSGDYTFALLDIDLKVIARENYSHILEEPERELAFHFGAPDVLENACANLLLATTASPTEFWRRDDPNNIRHIRGFSSGVQHALLSADVFALKDAMCTQITTTVRLPSGAWSSRRRIINAFLIPICFPKVESYGQCFFMVTFWVGDDNQQGTKGEES
ncbi:kinase-like protein [Lentithecium fluviatile CBS 122367]|uniref:Kinase-like protein n=1 Tax=Lentithecium fluviatile CBS 122367 TaxID=1168545 RepID=A0A6G1ITP6_9PLEO|nr:kinase-like protein [Lentithecium fluviatile CBS 122367]